jgi:uncharacterized BrkB/YihY/UPF0761 family membrane protein
MSTTERKPRTLPDTPGARRFRFLATLVLGALIPITFNTVLATVMMVLGASEWHWRALISEVAILMSGLLLIVACYRTARRNLAPSELLLVGAIACTWVTLLLRR